MNVRFHASVFTMTGISISIYIAYLSIGTVFLAHNLAVPPAYLCVLVQLELPNPGFRIRKRERS